MKWKYLYLSGVLYLAGITIVGICDTLNNGVEKRAAAQELRSERLERNQAILEERVARRQQRMADNMKRR